MSDNKFWSAATGTPAVYGPDDPWWHEQQDDADTEPSARRSTAVVLGDIWNAGGVVLYDTPNNLRRYLHDALQKLDAVDPAPPLAESLAAQQRVSPRHR